MVEPTKPEIVKEADFSNYAEDHRVVRLSAEYASYSSQEKLVFLQNDHHTIQSVQYGEVRSLSLDSQEMDTLCIAWMQFKADRETWEAKQKANPSYDGDPFLPDGEEVTPA